MGTNQANMATHHCEETETTCGDIARERNNFFTGKFMTARDFADEQHYHLSRHQLHNRILHGMGIVCGMCVLYHPSPAEECATWVVIRAGIAIDCCGREIVLEQDTALDLAAYLPEETSANIAGSTAQHDHDDKDNDQHNHTGSADEDTANLLVVGIRYSETPVEFVPALYAEGTCDPTRQTANRIRECWKLEVRRWQELDANCWPLTEGQPPQKRYDDCDQGLPGPTGVCLEPDCPCGRLVPLALIRPGTTGVKDGDKKTQKLFAIDMHGRPEMVPPPHHLTHIVWHNWPHGGTMRLGKLHNQLNSRLEIHFDRALQVQPEGNVGIGINSNTFIAQFYTGATETLEFLRFERNMPPTISEDKRVAIFQIDPDLTDPNNRRGLRDDTIIYVTLRCNFIMDCHGSPVDGDYLRGALPTGDGVPGGIFESWFRVVVGPAEEDDNNQKYE